MIGAVNERPPARLEVWQCAQPNLAPMEIGGLRRPEPAKLVPTVHLPKDGPQLGLAILADTKIERDQAIVVQRVRVPVHLPGFPTRAHPGSQVWGHLLDEAGDQRVIAMLVEHFGVAKVVTAERVVYP